MCNIYYYQQICFYWLFSFREKQLSNLKIGCTGSNKHNGMDYKNVLVIGILNLLLNLLSYHGFIKNNDSFVILKCPNRMSEYYFNKGFI